MKRPYLIIAIVLIGHIAGTGQGFLEGNPRWHIREFHFSPSEPGYSNYSRIYQMGRDTQIGPHTYSVLVRSDYRDTTKLEETDMLFRESGDTVYYRRHLTEGVYLINREEFVLDFKSVDNCELMWYNYDSVMAQGRSYFVNEYSVNRGSGPVRLIESVGYQDRMFWETMCVFDHPWHEIRCQYRNGELVYKIDDEEPCYLEPEFYTSTEEEKESVIQVYPTKISLGENVYVDGIDHGRVIMWNIQGGRIGVGELIDGAIQPNEKGIIILQILNAESTIHVAKVLVE